MSITEAWLVSVALYYLYSIWAALGQGDRVGDKMTIWLYSGTPGSGKSFHATKDIYTKLKKKSNNAVIANFAFDTKSPHFLYKDNSEITVEFLVSYGASES